MTSRPPPCWESSVDVFPRPCGNMTDSEKEIQLREGSRSEGTRTPRLKRSTKVCNEKNVDTLYLRAASQTKLAHIKSTSKSTTKINSSSNDEYVSLKPKLRDETSKSLRQTLLAINDNYVSDSISVNNGDVVTLLGCRETKYAGSVKQWFYIKCRNGKEGYIPAVVAGHGFL